MTEKELFHYGILGMKWGKRKGASSSRTSYKSSFRSRRAKKQNEKIDKSFKKWQYNDKIKKEAIELGKQKNQKQIEMFENPNNKQIKNSYKSINSNFKKATNKNTTYRKGQIKGEVEKDLARKFLSMAKKEEKKFKKNPSDTEAINKYQKAMNEHDIHRAKGRRAPEIAAKRSQKKASIKRGLTMSVKAAALTGVVTIGAYGATSMLKKQGKNINVSSDTLRKGVDYIKKGKDLLGYFM